MLLASGGLAAREKSILVSLDGRNSREILVLRLLPLPSGCGKRLGLGKNQHLHVRDYRICLVSTGACVHMGDHDIAPRWGPGDVMASFA